MFGCRSFRSQRHVTDASNATLTHEGELPATLGSFATISNPPKGQPIKRHRRYLDKVHLDIVFGDCVSLGGFRYALILVDVATRYCWIYGLTSVTSSAIIHALESFRAEAGGLPRRFHSDFDKKLVGGKALRWIRQNKSNIIAAPSKRQSSNGLVERTWQTIIKMARAYITEKQVGRSFWYYAIRHSAIMLNQVPGRLGKKLITPFEMVHGVRPDPRTWFQLFSVGYFNHTTDNGQSRSKSQAQTQDGIAVGRDENSNTILFYNPITKSYYSPPGFKLDESALPVTNYPKSIKFDGGLTCGRYRYNEQPMPEPFPPGTRVSVPQGETKERGTIQNVPLPFSTLMSSASNPDNTSSITSADEQSTEYTVLLDNGTTTTISFEDLTSDSHRESSSDSPPIPNSHSNLPHFLQSGCKVTMDHDGAYHKGYIYCSPEGGYQFVVYRNHRSNSIDFSVPLHNFKQSWSTLVGEDIIFPGHSTVSSFLKSQTNNSAPSASHVSAKNLLSPCPPSLEKAIHPSNPDRHIWLASYDEEKQGLIDHNVYQRISKKEYLALRRAGRIPKAIPSMCVLVIKPDKDGKPYRAKSRIVVLGNFEDRIYQKSQRYAPVLKYDSLRLLTAKAIADKRILQQGGCKNAFCNAELPDNECTVVRPPVGDPAYHKDEFWLLKKTLYGLRRSPHHWYDMITSILRDMGLQASPHDPCLFSGILNKPETRDPQDLSTATTSTSDTTSTSSSSNTPRASVYIGTKGYGRFVAL